MPGLPRRFIAPLRWRNKTPRNDGFRDRTDKTGHPLRLIPFAKRSNHQKYFPKPLNK